MTETVTIRLSPSTKATLETLARADRRKLSSYLSLVLEDHAEKADKPEQPRKTEPAGEGE